MSTSTTAELFYGFTFPHEQRTDGADYARDPDVEIDIFGSDGCLTDYVCAKASRKSVEIGTSHRLSLPALHPEWDRPLRAFCHRHGITWHAMGPGWHVAPMRF